MASAALFASTAAAQSTHLAQLQRSAPAVTIEAVTDVSVGGWASAWSAPAAAGRTQGILVGLEHSGFASMTSVFAAARFRLGPRWQASFAQIRLDDLFDTALLEQYPGLGTLGASATQLGLDGLTALGGVQLSGGIRYERDELIGETEAGWAIRLSAAAPVIVGIRSSAVVERRLNGSGEALGRVTVGLARDLHSGPISLTAAAGLALGDLWDALAERRVAGMSLRVSLAGLLSLAAAVGAERDVYAADGWLGFAAFGLGLSVGPIGAHVRRGGQADSQAAPTAFAVVFQPGGPTEP